MCVSLIRFKMKIDDIKEEKSCKQEENPVQVEEPNLEPNQNELGPTKGSATTHTQRTVSYFELFRYANGWDWCLIVVALIAALIRSLAFPLVIVIYSEMTAMFIDRHLGTSSITHFLPLFGGGHLL